MDEEQTTEAPENEPDMAALLAERDELRARVDRAEVAAAHGVPAELLTGSDREALEASAVALAEYVARRVAERSPVDFGAGGPQGVPSGMSADPVRDLIGRR